MKGWQVALLCLAIAAIAVAGTWLFIRQTEENTPQVDLPRYTADQVIAVAKAYAGEECDSDSSPTRWWVTYEKARWTTVYLGNGKWKVTRNCSPTEGVDWTFYEATGELKSS